MTPSTKNRNVTASRVQRILDDHDQMIRTLAANTGRSRQAVVNDALDAGLGLVMLHGLDPEAAREIMTELQRKLFRNFPSQA